MERYHELTAKVDAFFGQVRDRYRDAMQCGAGCSECCHVRLTVTQVEAAAISEGLATVDAAERTAIADGAEAAAPGICSALDGDGQCRIYRWRPLVCRSQGVPVKTVDDESRLPVVSACHLNFDGGAGLDKVDPKAVLDQTTLSTVLAAIEIAYANENGTEAGERVDLLRLLSPH